MRFRTLALALIATIPLLGWEGARVGRERADEAAVRDVVEKYFSGMLEGRPETLAEAFDPQALLIGPGHGAPIRIPFEEWSAGMDEPFENPDAFHNRIVSIDVAGDAAMAKTELRWPTHRYVDYLSLLKIDGRWRIVNKTWHQEPSEAVLSKVEETAIEVSSLEPYVGRYRVGETALDVWVHHGRLALARVGGSPNPLFHVGEDAFVPGFDLAGRVDFVRSGDRITGVRLRFGGRDDTGRRIE